MIIEGTFDPITQKELQYILDYRKDHHLRDIFIKVSDRGILTAKERQDLVKKAIAPYRHLHLSLNGRKDISIPDALLQEEEEVRHGSFRKAARGTKQTLNTCGYYLREITAYLCNPRRAVHSSGVALTAKNLAVHHHMDPVKAYRMGMLHDITKKLSDEEGRKILQVWYPQGLRVDPKIWHSYTAVFFLKQNMCIHDRTILNAIWHHTIGDGKSDWDHILYIADKIEPNRGYDSTYEMELSEKSLKAGADYVLKKSKEYIYQKEGKHV